MAFDPEKHHRRSIHLKGYDYRQPGPYFITICTQDRACFLATFCMGKCNLMRQGEW